MRPSLHFIAFRGDEYSSAVRVWGRPDFFHRVWDWRAVGDISPEDTVVFAKGSEHDAPSIYSFNDSEHF